MVYELFWVKLYLEILSPYSDKFNIKGKIKCRWKEEYYYNIEKCIFCWLIVKNIVANISKVYPNFYFAKKIKIKKEQSIFSIFSLVSKSQNI